VILALLLACAGGDDTGGDPCAEVSVVTWETFGAGFVTENCQSCHASTQTDREGAPADVTFDAAADVWARRDAVLRTAGAEPPTMPPLGGTREEDRQKLRDWLTCGIEGG
jgi:uncharacterized membrane protein